MNRRRTTFLSGLLFVSCSVSGQSATNTDDSLRISLLDAWQKAEKHSRIINIRKKDTEITSEETMDAQSERYPEIGVMASVEKATNIPIYENGIFSKPVQHEIIHTLERVGADFYLNLYNGSKLNLKIEENKILHGIATVQHKQSISDIRYNTAALYLELQKSFIFRNLILQDIADQEKQLKEIEALHKNGVVLNSDVLRVRLDLSRRKMALVSIENDIKIVSQKLNIIIGEPDETVIIPSEFNSYQRSNVSYEQFLQDALQNSFSYNISEQQTELTKVRLKQAKANLSLKAGLYGDFYYTNPQIFLYPYNPYWYSLGIAGLKVSFPVSELYHNTHKVRAAKYELEKEEESHKNIEDQIRQQVNEAFLRYKEVLVQIEVAETNVAQATENARIIKNTYFNQACLITDLLDADIQVLQTRFELVSAKILAQNKYYLLQNIIGIL